MKYKNLVRKVLEQIKNSYLQDTKNKYRHLIYNECGRTPRQEGNRVQNER